MSTFTACIFVATVLPGVFMACGKDKVAIGQQNADGQAPDGRVASNGTGGVAGSGGAVITGGVTTTGGVIRTGGLITTGGVIRTGGLATGGNRMDASADTPTPLDASMDTGARCGGLAGIPCAAGEYCDPPADMCQAADFFGTCKTKPQGCTTDYRPVCGCDNKTYSNECSRLAVGVAKRSDGECASTTVPCSQLTSQAACDTRGDCHSVFVDPDDCGCLLPGCCARFNCCAVGGRAQCDPDAVPLTCTIAVPHCSGQYVVSYANGCYEGCVLQTTCSGVDAGTTRP